ncbi:MULTISPECIES: GDSL-type esterase/lipase family protein [unclassified Sphingomonas]|uniref:GDSL-type esterase/lipase family protein n=1 Tax=unclassified Sphingomonas TaxID=196159 RepID=UPI001216A21C|nr:MULTISPECIES: GDSL-type esterase/lipase family protein [unclassified Sphingomonas]MBD8641553.1 GDSL family lipase [Sphingomonas sp. CFBP 13733]MBD8702047.1 GDSL family lipase [Sphingomonas sp. CFBP 13714]RZL85878.1 MAG: GDSL family lipase [Sphingomonas sp.]
MKVGVFVLALLSSAAVAQGYQSSPERRVVVERDWGQWLGPFRAKLVPSLMQDFGERYIYRQANAALPARKPGQRRVVFLGDSITDRWNLSASFPGQPYINRGIGSQVTAQMILRFHQDVIALHPRAVVILAGVNDVQGFLQQETPEQIKTNWEAMADLADAHHIKVVFGSLLPVNDYTEAARNVVGERKPDELLALNTWLRVFCAERGYAYADYYAALVDARGMLGRSYTTDGIHPLPSGYARMTPIASRAIAAALARN